jgi:DNA-binding transcriptional MerR regulator
MDNQLISIGKAARKLNLSIKTLQRWDKSGKFVSIRVGARGNRFYRQFDLDLLLKNHLALAKKWATDHPASQPDLENYCETRDIFQARLECLQADLAKNINLKLASLISAISGEIGNNSFDHNLGNWPDIMGIFFSYSLSQKEIVLADRGQGILTTLKRVKPELINHLEALKIAFTQTISGRSPEKRGNGLKFVKNIIIANPIGFAFQTGNAILTKLKDQDHYQIKVSEEIVPGCLAVIEY